ncbi:STY4534 family ICE replication protein [Pasteurella skyensis]|uniref:STY4534 family ICE replication protein n=1 Tax=Phocoenobacter skyensis TaxID=97481 RepID=UPI0027508A79|nr:STY4534 family ICE replication protein [Pasteurella skyensis]MDP8189089.1 STY4534 family ICE replication protein [Pasteurella skyensis]
MSTQKSTSTGYFNLHTTGIGYLSRIREVKPKKGNPFFACQIAALTGSSNSPEYRYFDVNVVGQDAEKLIKKCEKAVNEKKKVLISFVIADFWTELFTYSSDSKYHKKGDTGVSLKGRLIRIKMVKIDGELKYHEEAKTDTESQEDVPEAPQE